MRYAIKVDSCAWLSLARFPRLSADTRHVEQHPSHPSSALTSEEVTTLHHHIRDVTVVACAANADASAFPSHWLFSYRWGKGKKDGKKFVLPNGESVPIKYMTVGGRTSAVIEGECRA